MNKRQKKKFKTIKLGFRTYKHNQKCRSVKKLKKAWTDILGKTKYVDMTMHCILHICDSKPDVDIESISTEIVRLSDHHNIMGTEVYRYRMTRLSNALIKSASIKRDEIPKVKETYMFTGIKMSKEKRPLPTPNRCEFYLGMDPEFIGKGPRRRVGEQDKKYSTWEDE